MSAVLTAYQYYRWLANFVVHVTRGSRPYLPLQAAICSKKGWFPFTFTWVAGNSRSRVCRAVGLWSSNREQIIRRQRFQKICQPISTVNEKTFAQLATAFNLHRQPFSLSTLLSYSTLFFSFWYTETGWKRRASSDFVGCYNLGPYTSSWYSEMQGKVCVEIFITFKCYA